MLGIHHGMHQQGGFISSSWKITRLFKHQPASVTFHEMKIKVTHLVKLSNYYRNSPSHLGNPGLRLPWGVTLSRLCPTRAGLTLTENVISFAGLERMLKAYSSNSSFSDPESQKNTVALMDEVKTCRVQFPRFNDERFIFRVLVFWPIWLPFAFPFSWQNNLIREQAHMVRSLASSLKDLEKSN